MKRLAALVVGVAMLAPIGAHAQTVGEKEAIIALLWQQIEILQTQLTELILTQSQERQERRERREARTLRTNRQTMTEVVVNESKARIEVEVDGNGGKVGEDTIRLEVLTYNAKGKHEEVPVEVTTDNPDLPSKFKLSTGGYPSSHFIIAKDSQGVATGGPNPYPSTAGKFTFTFSAGGLEKTVEVEVTK